MSEENLGSTWKPRSEIAICSGEWSGSGDVRIIHGSAVISGVSFEVIADSGEGNLTLTFFEPFDLNDNVYFVAGIVFNSDVGSSSIFTPFQFDGASVIMSGVFPTPAGTPWTFAILAITSPEGGGT